MSLTYVYTCGTITTIQVVNISITDKFPPAFLFCFMTLFWHLFFFFYCELEIKPKFLSQSSLIPFPLYSGQHSGSPCRSGLITAGWQRSGSLLHILWHHPAERGRVPHYWQVGVEAWAPSCGLSSCHLPESFCVCYTYDVLSDILSVRNRKKYVHSIFL